MLLILLFIACAKAAGGEPNRMVMASVGLLLVGAGLATMFTVGSRL